MTLNYWSFNCLLSFNIFFNYWACDDYISSILVKDHQNISLIAYLNLQTVTCLNQSDESEMAEALTEEELAELADEDLYSRMAQSLAPEIYGHEDVKKALLLLLVGGVDKYVIIHTTFMLSAKSKFCKVGWFYYLGNLKLKLVIFLLL